MDTQHLPPTQPVKKQSISNPRHFLKVIAVIMLIFVLLFISIALVRDGLNGKTLRDEILPMLLIVVVLTTFVAIPAWLGLSLGRPRQWWNTLLTWGVVILVVSIAEFVYAPKGFFPSTVQESWKELFISLPINLFIVYLFIRHLLGRSKAIEMYMYERDEREQILTAKATRNAFIITLCTIWILGSVVYAYREVVFSASQVRDVLGIVIAILFISYSASLLKYRLE